MYGAAVWLVWVVSQQAGADGVLIVLSGAVLIGFAAWVFGATRSNARRGRAIGGALAAAIGADALLTLDRLAVAPHGRDRGGGGRRRPIRPSRLAALRAEGRPVFVNMTAAWCVTCLVNERVALSSDSGQRCVRQAQRRLSEGRLDAGRSGDFRVPQASTAATACRFTCLYPPHGEAPVVLPQILTEAAVLDELNRVGS